MTDPTKITVVIADDHPMYRDGVRQALEREPSIRLIGEAGDGERALGLLTELSPMAAVLDMNMPKMTGLQVAKEHKKRNGTTEFVFLTMFDDEEILNEAMDIGVRGYILKDSASVEIASAVRAVVGGKHYVSPTLSGKLVARKSQQATFEAAHGGLQLLTDTERKILALIAESKTSKEIGELLFLGQKTVENYRYKMCEKLGLSGAYSLLKFALENKDRVNHGS